MIRRGASLGEIAQVVRHRSLQTTQTYTKVEFEAVAWRGAPVAECGVQTLSDLHTLSRSTWRNDARWALGTQLEWPASFLRRFVDFLAAEGADFVTTKLPLSPTK
jgi:hypothetical protein